MSKEKISDIQMIAGVILFIVMLFVGAFSFTSCSTKEVQKVRVENARYPKAGDRIELNGQEVVILKKFVFRVERTYKVRLPNGDITEVMGSEIIDKVSVSLGEKI